MKWLVLAWVMLSAAVLGVGFFVEKGVLALAPAVVAGPPLLAALIFARATAFVLLAEVTVCLRLLGGRLWPRYLLVVAAAAVAQELIGWFVPQVVVLGPAELVVASGFDGLVALCAAAALAAPIRWAQAPAEASPPGPLEQFLDGPGRTARRVVPWVLVAALASRVAWEVGLPLPIGVPAWLFTLVTVAFAGLFAAPLFVPARPGPSELPAPVVEELTLAGAGPDDRRLWLFAQLVLGAIAGALAVAWLAMARQSPGAALWSTLSRPVLMGATAGAVAGSLMRTERGTALAALVIAAPAMAFDVWTPPLGPADSLWLLLVLVLGVAVEMGGRLGRSKPAPGVVPTHTARLVPAPAGVAVAALALLFFAAMPWLLWRARE